MTDLFSDQYLDQIRQLHTMRTWGASGYSHAPVVAKYRRQIGATTVLDYGCGRATLKKALIDIDPDIKPNWISEYDPAIPGKDNLPDPADLLVANDVLEHIEPDKVENTLRCIRALALKGAYFTIALSLSKVSLPDGRNAHLVIESEDWWLRKLTQAGFKIKAAALRKGLWVWAR